MRAIRALSLCIAVFVSLCGSSSTAALAEDIESLLSTFASETDLARKEQLLNEIIKRSEAGSRLLLLAKTTRDTTTKWMAIRGIGFVKYREAAPFLIKWLDHNHHWVRANAARALGEIREKSASSALIRLLRRERDGGVIEQASLALRWIQAKETIPVLKKAVFHKSDQTRCWVLQAIGDLGAEDDLSFLAKFLYNQSSSVEMCAANAIEAITKEDFGFPERSGPMNPQIGVNRAREWWKVNKSKYMRNK